MILLIDAGNTNITTGFYEKKIREVLCLETSRKARLIEEIRHVLARRGMNDPAGAILCSVVPRLDSFLCRAVQRNFGHGPLQVRHDLKLGLKLSIPNPEELGADRIANAVAAHRLSRGHTIVVDFGTATTFCFVTSRGEYKGGTIMPGIGISSHCLAEKTAKLPRVELRTPDNAIGGTTEENILSGLILGHAGAVERIIREMTREARSLHNTGQGVPVHVLATGGLAHLIVPHVRGIQNVHPYLTLEGLRIIYKLNV